MGEATPLAASSEEFLFFLRLLRLFAASSTPASELRPASGPKYHRLRRILEIIFCPKETPESKKEPIQPIQPMEHLPHRTQLCETPCV